MQLSDDIFSTYILNLGFKVFYIIIQKQHYLYNWNA